MFGILKTTRSVRKFSTEALPEEVTGLILEAGRLAGSAKNTQPWHFIAIRNQETLEQLSQCGANAWHLAGAAMGVALATADPFFSDHSPV